MYEKNYKRETHKERESVRITEVRWKSKIAKSEKAEGRKQNKLHLMNMLKVELF